MCGIAGFVGKEKHREEILSSILDKIINRGPDSYGMWFDEQSDVALGHRRLSIRDLSATGAQPMISQNQRWVITYNGEIYNAEYILEQIRKSESTFCMKGSSDTEVLLEAISCLGIKRTLQMCKGMFAAAVYDRREKKLYLFRDRFGEKPLYYGIVKGTFVFGSDLASIRQIPNFDVEIDRNVLPFYFSHGYIPGNKCIYSNVMKVKPAGIVTYEILTGNLMEEEYWSLEKCAIQGNRDCFKGSFEDASEELERLIIASVKSQLVSDVPIGVCLSGGIDSTLLTTLLQKNLDVSIDTFTIGVDNSNLDEAYVAKEISKLLGTRHHEEYISEQEMMNVVPKLATIYSEPFADSSQIPTYLVSKMAKKDVTVLLSGDAGDEFFCGYPIYWECEQLYNKLRKIPYSLRQLSGATIKYTVGRYNSTMYKAGNRLMSSSPADLMLRRKFATYAQERLAGLNGVREQGKYDDIWNSGMKDCKSKLMLLSASTYLTDDILTKVDRAGMAVSLENRIPLLDKDVVEFALSLPIEYKYDGGSKKILKHILYKYLPSEIMERPKQGFSVPVWEWILKDKGLRNWAESLLFDNDKSNDYYNHSYAESIWKEYVICHKWNQSLWYVLMFEAWRAEVSKV